MNNQQKTIEDLRRRKKIFREYMINLSPTEKIQNLMKLQENYYELLAIREKNGGKPIPEKWKKWHQARYEK